MSKDSAFPYEDILYLSRPPSPGRAKMSGSDRAAQFSPFAALSGYGDIIEETRRITQPRRELTEEETDKINRQLRFLSTLSQPRVSVTYFQPDATKPGGAYLTVTGTVKKIDAYRKTLVLTGGQSIPMADIFQLCSDCLEE